MDKKVEKVINQMYKGILYDRKTKKHRFLTDLEYAIERRTEYNRQMDMIYDVSNEQVKEYTKSKGRKLKSESLCSTFHHQKRMATAYELYSTYEKVKETKTEKDMYHILNEIIDFKLPGNVDNINDLKRQFVDLQNKSKHLNILIIGGGPVGLFLANYINQLYNQTYSDFKVNLVLLENRVENENIRYPFTRSRQFQIFTRYLDIVLPNIYCIKNNRSSYQGLYMPIKYLELLLYLKAYEEKIPIYLTRKYKDWKDIKELVRTLKIDVLYDASGGRVEGLTLDAEHNMVNNINMNSEMIKFKTSPKDNLVEVDLKSQEDYGMDKFLGIEFYGPRSFYHVPESFDLRFKTDFDYLTKKCIPKEDFLQFIAGLEEMKLKKRLIGYYLKEVKNNPNITHLQMNPFYMKMYHRYKVAQVFNVKNHEFLYIGAGDTIFSSHFVIGAGLNRTILFSVKTVHLLPMLLINS